MSELVQMVHDGIEAVIKVRDAAVAHHERAGWRRKTADQPKPSPVPAPVESAPAPDVPDASVTPDTPDTGDTPKEQ